MNKNKIVLGYHDKNNGYVYHDARIRLMEHLSSQINTKINVELTLISGSIMFTVVLKWIGWV